MGHFMPELLILLAKQFKTPYYRVSLVPTKIGHELVRVEVLSRVVEISTKDPGLRKFSPYFLDTARTEESSALGQFLAREDSTAFHRLS